MKVDRLGRRGRRTSGIRKAMAARHEIQNCAAAMYAGHEIRNYTVMFAMLQSDLASKPQEESRHAVCPACRRKAKRTPVKSIVIA